ncbi:prephenate dehydrogenase [Desulfallas thermosapovorans]|uniref:Prephenate dehydrogenase n=1 Tax=Desulfallas thermosapovorans DSM 6562 TaxID=1121431 RepID=A0A5S4ZSE1_9FIRM|nr:prephenate dehydrogenase [Desulfallas thermosapovorans]TYO95568.1 prephenate dehydrogenase [Desulfallas thermosapovorans DSM 6562]
MLIKSCAIIGVGLIGGSLGLAMSERQLVGHIRGVDVNRENLDMALAAGAIHQAAALPDAVTGAELVILAAPVGTTQELLKSMKPFLKPGAVITDVGSTKKSVVQQAEALIGDRFVGGHPMTGAETAGFSGADPFLFENAFYLLTPTAQTNNDALETVRRLVQATGAVVMEMTPEEHDLITAAISHLPHFMAVSLVAAVAGMSIGDKAMALAAGGFRDTTRIAAGSPPMWRDIFLSNRRQVLQTLEHLRGAMDELESALRRQDAEKLMQILSETSAIRKKLPVKPKGYLPYIYELVVTVPDRPGVIAGLAGMLGEAGINIAEIEILRAREGYGGTIRIGFATPDEQDRAMELFQARGIKCRRKV